VIQDTDVLCEKMKDKHYGKDGPMKKSIKLQRWLRTAVGAVVLMAVLVAGLDTNTIVSLADSAGKVTATSAKIRKEPNTSSETVGSAVQDAKVSVTGQIKGSDGYTWYKVNVDGGSVGYIRGDLMEITDGSTPAAIVPPTTSSSSATSSTPTTSTPDEKLVDVAEVEPVSASVSSNSPVRVRQNASTTSRIVTTAQSGLALTVVGQATGTDNKEWYQVTFISNGSEVSGFIRADYVSVSGDLVPAGSVPEPQPEVQQPEVTPEPETTAKAWDTYYDTKWHLVDNTTGNSYDIDQIFSSVEANTKTLQDTLSENKTQQIVIIILIILVILLATGVSFLIFKIKDMSDSAYFNQVEQETIRRRTADRPVSRPANGGQKVMQTVGTEGNKRPANGGQRPAGQRPQGAQSSQRPAGQRPQGAQGGQRPASQRPQGTQGGQRPAGQRPQSAQGGQRPAGQRPQGAQGGQRPAGQRPQSAQGGQRPVAQRPQGSAQPPVRQRPVEVQEPIQEVVQDVVTDDTIVYQAVSSQNNVTEQAVENTAWQSKNFANEDEMEFQFLDWNDEQ